MTVSIGFEKKTSNLNSFKKTYSAYFGSVVTFIQRITNDYDAAVDLAQDTFVSMLDKQDTIRNEEAIKSYLYSTARNKALNYLRSLKVREKYVQEEIAEKDNEIYFQQLAIEEDAYRLILKSIQENLNDQCRKVLLHSLKGAKNHEIAELLDISVNTVKYHKKNAYRILKLKLQDVAFLLALSGFLIAMKK
ncbi:sigma-70 family RNA polymerase sigma factor [Pedobacter sp. HMF7647]|uniref:RNA polymerase sigma factor SigS n=1 Tax=Hufsiella arboris TaxID=2695275 RepID=A0A7K1YE71_9SPHI|nr:sigma-70 family RNA polymerase sigma factor [Hufsiella arboris]MXV52339.1 sigma-70 family RNA polymerase sigma factor [Hufsiella arboris]